MVGDKVVTDIVCMTKVSALMLSRTSIDDICARRPDLRQVFHREQFVMKALNRPLALDYITPVNVKEFDERGKTLLEQELKMRLKNAIMQHWNKIKVANRKPSF